MERLLEELGDVLPTRAQAEAIMERALKVLYYRDKSTYNNWSIGFAEKVIFFKFWNKINNFKMSKNKTEVQEPRKLTTDWRIADHIRGYE